MPPSILLIAPDAVALPIAETMRLHLGADVIAAPTRRSALSALRRQDFELILVDETVAATDPTAADLIYQRAGGALILDVNFAISGGARLVRVTRAALSRHASDRARARTQATAALQQELNAALSGILLEVQLALREASPEQQPRLAHLVQLCTGLRDQLRP